MEAQAIEEVTDNTEDEEVIAKIKGENILEMPRDLFIPPDALSVILDTFEGPLDLLLYLIRKQNLDILDIPIADITHQYVEYVELMKAVRLELAGEYLVMAAILAEIKSRMLLPRPETVEDEEEDPRAELVRRLQEYERFKTAAENIGNLPCMDKDIFGGHVDLPKQERKVAPPQVTMQELVMAFADILKRSDVLSSHKISQEPLSVRERMSKILNHLQEKKFIPFIACFNLEEGRPGLVVSFLAVLELLKLGMIDVVQAKPFAPIHIKIAKDEEDIDNE